MRPSLRWRPWLAWEPGRWERADMLALALADSFQLSLGGSSDGTANQNPLRLFSFQVFRNHGADAATETKTQQQLGEGTRIKTDHETEIGNNDFSRPCALTPKSFLPSRRGSLPVCPSFLRARAEVELSQGLLPHFLSAAARPEGRIPFRSQRWPSGCGVGLQRLTSDKERADLSRDFAQNVHNSPGSGPATRRSVQFCASCAISSPALWAVFGGFRLAGTNHGR